MKGLYCILRALGSSTVSSRAGQGRDKPLALEGHPRWPGRGKIKVQEAGRDGGIVLFFMVGA